MEDDSTDRKFARSQRTQRRKWCGRLIILVIGIVLIVVSMPHEIPCVVEAQCKGTTTCVNGSCESFLAKTSLGFGCIAPCYEEYQHYFEHYYLKTIDLKDGYGSVKGCTIEFETTGSNDGSTTEEYDAKTTHFGLRLERVPGTARWGTRRWVGMCDQAIVDFVNNPLTPRTLDEVYSVPSEPTPGPTVQDVKTRTAAVTGAKIDASNEHTPEVVVVDSPEGLAAEIKSGMRHAFQAYMRDAWKSDEYMPVSKQGVNTFGGKGLTIIDSLDTLFLMDLTKEYNAAKQFVENEFTFNGDNINVFENNIRVLGGLLSAYTLTQEPVFLTKATEVGEVLLRAFRHRIPCGIISSDGAHCSSQSWAGGKSINAEVGTLSLEFETLSYLTGDTRWSDKIKAINQYWESRPKGSLLQMYVSPHTEEMSGPRTIGGGIDSTYEYFLKLKLLNGDSTAAELYQQYEPQIVEDIFSTGVREIEHLGCFAGGMLILGNRYADKGLEFTETCAKMYTTTASGIACDSVKVQKDGEIQCGHDIYLLRPETVESLFYAWRSTHDQKWRDYAESIWNALRKHCGVSSGGFTDVKYVTRDTPEKLDKQESWFLAETLKYLWLIFQPDDVVSLEEYVFNTECHPLKIVTRPTTGLATPHESFHKDDFTKYTREDF